MSPKKFKIYLFSILLGYAFVSSYLYPFNLRMSADKTVNGNLHYRLLSRGKVETTLTYQDLLLSLTCANNYATDDQTCLKNEIYKSMDNAKVSVVYFESKESIYGFKRLNKVISIRDKNGNYLYDKAKDPANYFPFLIITVLAVIGLIQLIRVNKNNETNHLNARLNT